MRLRGGERLRSKALCLGASTPLKRTMSPPIVKTLAMTTGEVMRIDVHPADFNHSGHVATLERLLERANGRSAVTYDELLR